MANFSKKELTVNKDHMQHAEELLWNTAWQEIIISRDGFEFKPETLSSLCDQCFINDDIMNYFSQSSMKPATNIPSP